jgi:di/tricarboxylate transporter
MVAEYVYLFGVLAIALYLFWSQRLATDLVAVLVLLSLILPWPRPDGAWAPILTYEEGFAGFGSAAVIMIASMFVMGAAMVQTGAAEAIGLKLLRRVAEREWTLQLSALAVSTALSTVINDTTVVVIMLPLMLSICRERGLAPSRYLLLVAYGSLLGGQWTLIGTRSNILVSDFLRARTGEGIGFFDFTPTAALVFVVSALFLMLLGRHLLPDHKPAQSRHDVTEFLTEVTVPEGSGAIGRRIAEIEVFQEGKLAVFALLRRGERRSPRAPLQAGDELIIQGTVDRIGALLKSSDFTILEEAALDEAALERVDLATVEAILPVNSAYAGSTLNELDFARGAGVTVLGLAHHGRLVTEKPMDTALQFGDSLLFFGAAGNIRRLRANRDLILLEERSFPAIGRRKAWIVAALLVAVIGTAVSGLLAPAIIIPTAAVLAILLGCIGLRAAYAAIDWPTLMVLGGMIPFSLALEKTGAAEAIAHATVRQLAAYDPVVLLGALLLIAILFTQVIENAAVAIIIAPVAFEVAQAADLDPKALMIPLAIVVSAGFTTPVAHESTILVMGPGQYEFRHYLKIGSVLVVITWVIATLVTPLLWPLR